MGERVRECSIVIDNMATIAVRDNNTSIANDVDVVGSPI